MAHVVLSIGLEAVRWGVVAIVSVMMTGRFWWGRGSWSCCAPRTERDGAFRPCEFQRADNRPSVGAEPEVALELLPAQNGSGDQIAIGEGPKVGFLAFQVRADGQRQLGTGAVHRAF